MLASSTTTIPSRPSFKEQVALRVLDNVNPATGAVTTSEAKFMTWLDKEGWAVRDQSVARTAISTFVERRLRADNGVWIKDDFLYIGRLGGGTPYKYELPYWMVVFITKFPKAPWAKQAAKLAKTHAVAVR